MLLLRPQEKPHDAQSGPLEAHRGRQGERTIFASTAEDSTGASSISTASLAKEHLQKSEHSCEDGGRQGGTRYGTHVIAAATTKRSRTLDAPRMSPLSANPQLMNRKEKRARAARTGHSLVPLAFATVPPLLPYPLFFTLFLAEVPVFGAAWR